MKLYIFPCVTCLAIALLTFNKTATAQDDVKVKTDGLVAYSPGTYAPLGLMVGNLWKKGHGIYGSARCNFQIFKKAKYHFDGSAVDDHSLDWYYTGEKKYSRWELNAGGIFQLFGKKNGWSIKLYAGAGIEKPRYLYAYSQSSKFGNVANWVEYKELGHANINTEAGMFFWLANGINFHVGCSTIQKKHERMYTFGIGVN